MREKYSRENNSSSAIEIESYETACLATEHLQRAVLIRSFVRFNTN
jgi:hypothetical protein